MHKKIQQKDSGGFTIIEVLIVLAIAGLIIAIVLFAVPTLQRNGRNTAIKSDANQVLAYVSDFNANNDGAMPTTGGSSATAGAIVINNASGTATNGKIQSGTTATFTTGTATVTPAAGALTVVYGSKCPNTVTGTTVTPVASTRSTAVIYAIETSGALAAKCVGS